MPRQNDDYLKDISKTLKIKSGVTKPNYLYSKTGAVVATNSPFRSDQVILMGLKPPFYGKILGSIIPDPTEFGKQEFGVIFMPQEGEPTIPDTAMSRLPNNPKEELTFTKYGKPVQTLRTRLTFETLRILFGMTIGQIYKRITK